MKETFYIEGMSCAGCKNNVERIIGGMPGVHLAEVDLSNNSVIIDSEQPLTLSTLRSGLSVFDGKYEIDREEFNQTEKQKTRGDIHLPDSVYYCPMFCEGEKSYPSFGSCPICGMDLVFSGIYEESDNAHYLNLVRKFKWSVLFTLPIFFIAMSEMIPGNPLYELMSVNQWNWVQLALSIPVVFYSCRMFFEKAWTSFRTWNLNMFSLIGLGAGVAWLFSVFAIAFPLVFSTRIYNWTWNGPCIFRSCNGYPDLGFVGPNAGSSRP